MFNKGDRSSPYACVPLKSCYFRGAIMGTITPAHLLISSLWTVV